MLSKLVLLYSRRFAAMLLTRLEVCYKKKFVWERINQKGKKVLCLYVAKPNLRPVHMALGVVGKLDHV